MEYINGPYDTLALACSMITAKRNKLPIKRSSWGQRIKATQSIDHEVYATSTTPSQLWDGGGLLVHDERTLLCGLSSQQAEELDTDTWSAVGVSVGICFSETGWMSKNMPIVSIMQAALGQEVTGSIFPQ